MTIAPNDAKSVLLDIYGCSFHLTGNGLATLEMLASVRKFVQDRLD